MKTQTAEEPVMTLPEAMAEIERLRQSSARYLGRVAELVLEREDLRDLAYERAPKQLAEECERQKAELRAQLEDEQARRIAAEREAERLSEIITECDGVECVKHDTLVCGMLETRLAAEERADRAERKLEEAQTAYAGAEVENDILRERQARASSLAERYRLALEAVEWVDHSPFDSTCPWCERPSLDGHKPDCQRQAALEGKGPSPTERYRQALIEIRDGRIPHVCPEFEICKHEGCQASYAAFTIADDALRGAEAETGEKQ